MPFYEYQCGGCDHRLEVLQKISDEPLVFCPQCNEASMKKLISVAAFRLKGSGWYETDFKHSDKKKEKSADKKSSDAKSESSGSSDKSSDKSSDTPSDKNGKTSQPDKGAVAKDKPPNSISSKGASSKETTSAAT